MKVEERTVAKRSMAVPNITGTYRDGLGGEATVRHLRGDMWRVEDAIGYADFDYENMRYFLRVRGFVRQDAK